MNEVRREPTRSDNSCSHTRWLPHVPAAGGKWWLAVSQVRVVSSLFVRYLWITRQLTRHAKVSCSSSHTHTPLLAGLPVSRLFGLAPHKTGRVLRCRDDDDSWLLTAAPAPSPPRVSNKITVSHCGDSPLWGNSCHGGKFQLFFVTSRGAHIAISPLLLIVFVCLVSTFALPLKFIFSCLPLRSLCVRLCLCLAGSLVGGHVFHHFH